MYTSVEVVLSGRPHASDIKTTIWFALHINIPPLHPYQLRRISDRLLDTLTQRHSVCVREWLEQQEVSASKTGARLVRSEAHATVAHSLEAYLAKAEMLATMTPEPKLKSQSKTKASSRSLTKKAAAVCAGVVGETFKTNPI